MAILYPDDPPNDPADPDKIEELNTAALLIVTVRAGKNVPVLGADGNCYSLRHVKHLR